MQYLLNHGPGRPRATKSADTRERILRVARGVFSELGYDATTFQTIAMRADLTRPAINHYFPSKKVLYAELLDRANRVDIIPAIELARCETGLIARLASFIASMGEATVGVRSAGGFVVAAMLEAERHPELRPAVDALQRSSRDFLTWVISDAVECGELTTAVEVSSLVEVLTAVLWGVAFYGGLVGSHLQLAAVTAHLQLLLAHKLWQLNG